MEDNWNGAAEPAQFRQKDHRQNITEHHGAGLDRAKSHQITRPAWPSSGEKSGAAPDVPGYFDHDHEHEQLDRQKNRVGHKSGVPFVRRREPVHRKKSNQRLP
jgi:hypothetical protein